MTQLAVKGLVGLPGTRWGGLGLFLAGWGWARGWKMGTGGGEELLRSSRESPGLHANLGK